MSPEESYKAWLASYESALETGVNITQEAFMAGYAAAKPRPSKAFVRIAALVEELIQASAETKGTSLKGRFAPRKLLEQELNKKGYRLVKGSANNWFAEKCQRHRETI